MGSDRCSSWKHESEPHRTGLLVSYLLMNKREVCSPPHTIHKRNQSQRVINDLDNVDFILSKVQSSHQTFAHQATQNGKLIRLGLLKSGNLMN